MSNGNKPAITRIEIRVDNQRTKKLITFGEILDFEAGEAKGVAAVVSKLMWNAEKDEYYDPVEALKFLRGLTMEQIEQLSNETRNALVDVAVPPNSEGASESD